MVAITRRAERQRQVEVGARARALAALVGAADEPRVVLVGVHVDADELHIAALVEDLLRAVAVVCVDVEHRDTARARRRSTPARRWPRCSTGRTRRTPNVSRGARAGGTASRRSRSPASRRSTPDRAMSTDASAAGHEPSLSGDDVSKQNHPRRPYALVAGGLPDRHRLDETGMDEHLGDHGLRVGKDRHVVLPRRRQEVDEVGVVHAQDRAPCRAMSSRRSRTDRHRAPARCSRHAAAPRTGRRSFPSRRRTPGRASGDRRW